MNSKLLIKSVRHNLAFINTFSNKTILNKYTNFPRVYCSLIKPAQNMGVPLNNLIEKLQNLAPLKLAESWDNVGLLIQPNEQQIVNKTLLTIDLTEEVVQEAVDKGVQLIISYHPNIFRPLKRVTQNGWKERIVIKCIQHNIAVFSPHTSWDAMQGGVNDWLASFAETSSSIPIIPNSEDNKIGMGRLLTLSKSISLKEAIDKVKKHIGLPHLRLGLANNGSLDKEICTVAVCAGSGASVFANTKADLYLTGEMSHHEVLEATQNGINVILCNHSDSERGFLKNLQNLIGLDIVQFIVSSEDRDCLTTV